MKTTDEHGHIAFFYGSKKDRTQTLAQYFREGLEKGELGVFATPDSPKKVISDFRRAGFDIAKYVESGALRIFEMNKTYLPNGKFVAEYMITNVAVFIEDAKVLGYTGLRTAGVMDWLKDRPETWAEAFAYEEAVNQLSRKHPSFTGLCLYPVQGSSDEVLEGAIKTHPRYISKGKEQNNSLFGSSELGRQADREVKKLLTNQD